MVKRLIQATVVGYLVIAVATRVMESTGAYTCACEPDCWCKKPGLSLFRWVMPRWHHIGLSRTEKMRLG
jgi:hypothetical protein